MNEEIYKLIRETKASQNKTELTFLVGELQKIKPKRILEIGTWLGYSAQLWYDLFKPELVLSVENDLNRAADWSLMDKQIVIEFGNSHKRDTFDKIKRYVYPKGIPDDTPAFFDFLFIDGDHSYKGVKRDFEFYSPFVRPGGIIAFHDACLKTHPGVEVHILWEELEQRYPKNSTSIYNPSTSGTGTGILYV